MSYALNLSGNPSYLSAPSNNAYNFGTGDFTLQCWVKTTASGTVISRKSTQGGSGWGGFLLVIKSDGSIKLATDNGSGFYEIDTQATAIRDGNWHFLTGVRQSSQLTIYLDGAPVPSSVRNNMNPPIDVNNSIALFIGAVAQQQEQFNQFSGQLDEVRIWNKALSQEQIQSTMNQPLSGNESGLVGYFTFDAQNGNDSSPVKNNASPVGSVNYISPGVFNDATVIEIPQNTMISLSGTSYSEAYETVSVAIEGYDPIVFSGTGENVSLKSNGQSLVTVNSKTAASASLTFRYSTDGPDGPFKQPTVNDPVIAQNGPYVTVTIKTENGDDQDNNDSIFVMNWSVAQ